MNLTLASSLVIFFALAAANLPFLSDRFFLMFTPKSGKVFWQRMVEWAVYGLIVLALARWLETQINLENYPQTGEFFWVLIIAQLTFAYPGFIYRYFWHKPVHAPAASPDDLDGTPASA